METNDDWLVVHNVDLTTVQAAIVQYFLKAWDYPGTIDGLFGPTSWKAFQRLLNSSWGYVGKIDGVPGPVTIAALQCMLSDWGYTGQIDGAPGPKTRAAFKNFANGQLC